MQPLAAKQVILELLRVAPGPIAVGDLVTIGSWFDLDQNAVRVALARLKQRGVVQAAEGKYTLDPASTGVSDWAESWRQGDDRLKPWHGAWLCALLPKGRGAADRRSATKALQRYGYAPGLTNLWVRPANLRAQQEGLTESLARVGLPNDVVLFQATDFPTDLSNSWQINLWPTQEITARLEQALQAVRASNTELKNPPSQETLLTAFRVGSHALRQLAQDPLLPDQICDGAPRRALTQAMLRYDERGRELWNTETVSVLISQSKPTPTKKADRKVDP